MSVSNGVIQTIVQGCHDETDTLPELVKSVDDNMTLISTPLFVANASLSEDGGESDSRCDNEP